MRVHVKEDLLPGLQVSVHAAEFYQPQTELEASRSWSDVSAVDQEVNAKERRRKT